MPFRGFLRPGQGFKPFQVYRRIGGLTPSGRPRTADLEYQGEILGIVSQASPKEIEQFKQRGTPITHTIVQRGTEDRAKANDVLVLEPDSCCEDDRPRKFLVHGDPKEPGELAHFLVYTVEERDDLQ